MKLMEYVDALEDATNAVRVAVIERDHNAAGESLAAVLVAASDLVLALDRAKIGCQS